MQNKTKSSVKDLVNKLKTEKEEAKQKKIREEKRVKDASEKLKRDNAGKDLVAIFKKRFFSLDSSESKVAKVIADMDEYYVFPSWSEIIWYRDSEIFQGFLKALSLKFNIKISTIIKKSEGHWSGSGDDMTYYREPAQLRIYFEV